MNHPHPSRRRFLQAAGILAASSVAGWSLARPLLVNPCRAALPAQLLGSPWISKAWDGIDPAQVWDCHVHLAGTGDGGSGIVVGPQLSSPLRPLQYAQRLFYMNAGCAHDAPGQVDGSYVDRLLNLVDGMAPGFKLMLFAFEHFHDEQGRPQPEQSAFYVPDAYARQLAAAHPQALEWVASIHPYRPDAVERLEAAAAQGARAVKWLPAAMNIDPASPRCDAFYAALARTRLPLITHCGEEKAVQGADTQHYGNPLLLRRALEQGVRVVVAHCASIGEDADLDRGGERVSSFELFARLMDEPRWGRQLAGDISAIVLRNRNLEVIKTLLQRQDWHGRLLNGSDYPLPGILPLISPAALASAGLLPQAAVADLELLREHNPLYFDFALKRAMCWQGKGFAPGVFATRKFFEIRN